MKDQTLSLKQYLATMPPERRAEVEKVWGVVRENIPAGYVEEIGPKFISYKASDDSYVALANWKNYISLYLMPLYVFPELKAKLDKSEKPLKCGKSCINFKRAEDLPLDILAEIVGATDTDSYRKRVREAKNQHKK